MNFLIGRRKFLKLSKRKVSQQLGMDDSYIFNIETDRIYPSVVILEALSDIYDVTREELLSKAGILKAPLLDAILKPESVPDEELFHATDTEKNELKRYLAFLRLKQT